VNSPRLKQNSSHNCRDSSSQNAPRTARCVTRHQSARICGRQTPLGFPLRIVWQKVARLELSISMFAHANGACWRSRIIKTIPSSKRRSALTHRARTLPQGSPPQGLLAEHSRGSTENRKWHAGVESWHRRGRQNGIPMRFAGVGQSVAGSGLAEYDSVYIDPHVSRSYYDRGARCASQHPSATPFPPHNMCACPMTVSNTLLKTKKAQYKPMQPGTVS
jgi:hypothetical protein